MPDPLPRKDGKDVAHVITKATLSAIPFVGGPAAELFNLAIQPPLERRREEWLEGVVKELNTLAARTEEFDIAHLIKNEQFITVVLHATQVALRNHQQMKLDALKKAVINTAARKGPDENLQLMFINMVDEMTPLHLEVLAIVRNPRAWGEKHGVDLPNYTMGSRETVVAAMLGERKPDYLDQIFVDLHNRGLVRVQSLHGSVTGPAMYDSLSSELGNSFLDYIGIA